MSANTLFLRLEGPMQSWGAQESKFVVRRTTEAPTKSGVIGLLCAALGVSRPQATKEWLSKLSNIRMGVRIDVPGIRWWDYHTVGAGMEMRIAEGGTKPGAMLTRREYLCDASFMVALQGEPAIIDQLTAAILDPAWTLYLGRKCCPPSRPIHECLPADHPDLIGALAAVPWRPRLKNNPAPQEVDCLVEWQPTATEPEAPADALVCYDVPLTFDPPAHRPRFVLQKSLRIGINGEVELATHSQNYTPRPLRPRADYKNSEYRNARAQRLKADQHLCIFCKSPGTTVQHITYRRAGGTETQEDLRSLCRLCHDAVTMIEYGLGMGLDRINPEDPHWRDKIIQKRREIIRFRSLETRRRRLSPEEVE